jgi:drug/metabolite transporter (DMT)-like permease
MKNLLFYIITILIWGSTWIGIKMQLGLIDPTVSVTYRFALAAVILFAWCRLRKLNMRFNPRAHLFMALQGALLFGFNYLLFYMAELHVTSGLAAVIFSTILLMNMINGAIFLRTPIDGRVVGGGLLGLAGIILVFRPEITSFSIENKGVLGIVLCVVATLLASWGNITSAYNQKNGLPIVQTNAYGMGYGALIMFCTALICQKSFAFDLSPVYLGSLVYLAVFGSVIAFGCYLTLVGNIGADRAAYATLLFPIVALVISTIWVGYQWTLSAGIGVTLIVFGNLLMLRRKKKRERPEDSSVAAVLSGKGLGLKRQDS